MFKPFLLPSFQITLFKYNSILTGIHEILSRHFHYSSFRGEQEQIIQNVIQGKDTVVLMPTGGGKSMCYQIPALFLPGFAIAISPLVALMKDQVENLKKKNIYAAAIHTGQSFREQQEIFDQCINGKYKLLYVSPERLQSKYFMERLPYFNINLIAIDEAHCISAWGYDFRPLYLLIKDLKNHIKPLPFMALTASATPLVLNDIIEKLDLQQPKIFRQSFKRDNIAYHHIFCDDKLSKLLQMVSKNQKSGLVYVRTRKLCKEIAEYLITQNIKVTYYHAGLSNDERLKRETQWKNNEIHVMICTNAFGMGIDKADVNYVIHYNFPESIEAYYQESGRAGRNGATSFAIVLYNRHDIEEIKQNTLNKLPDLEVIHKIYNAICNYLQIAVGAGFGETYDFDLQDFCEKFKLEANLVFRSIKLLEENKLIQFSERTFHASTLKIIATHNELYKFKVENANFDNVIAAILRLYEGVYTDFVSISEIKMANFTQMRESDIKKQLKHLHQLDLIDYTPSNNLPKITLLQARFSNEKIVSEKWYSEKINRLNERMQSTLTYVSNDNICRVKMMLAHFGEKTTQNCGNCDICKKQKPLHLHESLRQSIVQLLAKGNLSTTKVIENFGIKNQYNVAIVLRQMIENNEIYKDENDVISVRKFLI